MFNYTPCPHARQQFTNVQGCGHLSAKGEIFQPFCGFWCVVTTSAPKQFVDYPFTITKYKNYFRKKPSDLEASTISPPAIQVFF
jgi:hypothetical protein